MRARLNDNDKTAFLLTYRQAAERYNVGLNTVQKMAKNAGAVRHFGKCARVVADVLDNYVLTLSEDED